MKIPNKTVNGITYIDCESIDRSRQEPCPLVEPGLSHLCVNRYQDPRYRTESCEHTEFCKDIAQLHTQSSK